MAIKTVSSVTGSCQSVNSLAIKADWHVRSNSRVCPRFVPQHRAML